MADKPNLPLVIALIMFPQIVETIYSPALPEIAEGYEVTASTAGLTLSLPSLWALLSGGGVATRLAEGRPFFWD